MAGIYVELLEDTGRDGEILRLGGRRFLVGRAAHCEVRVDAEIVSREHVALVLEDESWLVRDLDSLGGTWLNGEEVRSATLRPLDEIHLGPEGPRLRIVTMDPAPAIPDEGEEPIRPTDDPPPAPRQEEEIPTVAPLPPASPEPRQQPGREAKPPAPPAPAKPRRSFPPVLALLGLAFATSISMGVLGENFPYEPATAPILWVMAAFRFVAPDAIPDPGIQLWVFRGLLAVYGLFAGFLLQHPFRRVVYLLALAGLHVLAAMAL